MPGLQVRSLKDDELTLAYPLVRSVARVELSRWLGFAHALIAARGGIIGVRASGGCLYGAATFLTRPSLEHERILEIDLLAAIELGRGSHVERVLRDRLNVIARKRGCRALAYRMAGSKRPEAAEDDKLAHHLVVIERAVSPASAKPGASAQG